MPHTANEIIELRTLSGKNKGEFAEMLGISRYWLFQLENGEKEAGELVDFKLTELSRKLNLHKVDVVDNSCPQCAIKDELIKSLKAQVGLLEYKIDVLEGREKLKEKRGDANQIK